MTEEQIQKKLFWIKKKTEPKNEEFKITKFELPVSSCIYMYSYN